MRNDNLMCQYDTIDINGIEVEAEVDQKVGMFPNQKEIERHPLGRRRRHHPLLKSSTGQLAERPDLVQNTFF